jgi:hypothetical protein
MSVAQMPTNRGATSVSQGPATGTGRVRPPRIPGREGQRADGVDGHAHRSVTRSRPTQIAARPYRMIGGGLKVAPAIQAAGSRWSRSDRRTGSAHGRSGPAPARRPARHRKSFQANRDQHGGAHQARQRRWEDDPCTSKREQPSLAPHPRGLAGGLEVPAQDQRRVRHGRIVSGSSAAC